MISTWLNLKVDNAKSLFKYFNQYLLTDTVVCLNLQFILFFFLEKKSEFHSRIRQYLCNPQKGYLSEITIFHHFHRDSWIYSAIWLTSIYCICNGVLGTGIQQINPASWSLYSDGRDNNKQNKWVSNLPSLIHGAIFY